MYEELTNLLFLLWFSYIAYGYYLLCISSHGV